MIYRQDHCLLPYWLREATVSPYALKIKTARFRSHYQGVFVHRKGGAVTFLLSLKERPITTVPQMEVTSLHCGVHWTVSAKEIMFIVVS